MSIERVGDVTCETVHYAGGKVRRFPIHGETYWAMYADASHKDDSPYVSLLGSAWGVLVDELGGGARVFSTRERAEAAQAALPEYASGKQLPIGRVVWHGGHSFTLV